MLEGSSLEFPDLLEYSGQCNPTDVPLSKTLTLQLFDGYVQWPVAVDCGYSDHLLRMILKQAFACKPTEKKERGYYLLGVILWSRNIAR